MLYKIERNPLCKKDRTRNSQKRTLHGNEDNEEKKERDERQVRPVEEDVTNLESVLCLFRGRGGERKEKRKNRRRSERELLSENGSRS